MAVQGGVEELVNSLKNPSTERGQWQQVQTLEIPVNGLDV